MKILKQTMPWESNTTGIIQHLTNLSKLGVEGIQGNILLNDILEMRKEDYSTNIKRMVLNNPFLCENVDYFCDRIHSDAKLDDKRAWKIKHGLSPKDNSTTEVVFITINTAKQVCLASRTAKGHQARQELIDYEESQRQFEQSFNRFNFKTPQVTPNDVYQQNVEMMQKLDRQDAIMQQMMSVSQQTSQTALQVATAVAQQTNMMFQMMQQQARTNLMHSVNARLNVKLDEEKQKNLTEYTKLSNYIVDTSKKKSFTKSELAQSFSITLNELEKLLRFFGVLSSKHKEVWHINKKFLVKYDMFVYRQHDSGNDTQRLTQRFYNEIHNFITRNNLINRYNSEMAKQGGAQIIEKQLF
ncbi:hypothetical protein KMW28_27310 [Flammeovirga yaeyamensis]|uniref:Uncharacterized protein n=1 Tax=Flammeovirga yaeyamensis TaxID=367791 RepID=A0AAX1NDX3_9BACT|nr:hypothetical protein [Flammeovirga yaeyamensis]MBB3700009.1 phage anti-repressor protein [Flammeovirga yaeyamensis]NMF37553.1 hypothetical protein [Flammeovirga yaeyamensis]QWG04610.1 hypothetical protein KMW28_27310 [Flammeovirga yaeyamensis]